jgi:serine/threonine-protein kinase
MELLPGPSLEEELADRGRLSSGEVRDLAVQTLSALAEAHADGTIHCDVKPSNILRAADGTWKLVDFGIACAGADAPEDEFWGTPGYVPPERLAGTPAAPVGDLYSLSVVLYEALTGVQPFARDCVEATIAAVRAGRHAATASVRPDADPLLASAIDRGMAPTPSERFAAAHDMAAAIERASKQQETPPLATAPIPVLAPTEQLTPAKVGAPRRTRTLPDAAGASHHRRSRLIALGIGLAAVAVLVTLTLAMTNQGMRAHARARTTGFDQAFTASTPAVRVSTPPASSTQVSSPAPSPASHDGPAITGPGNGNGNGHAYGHSKGNH